MSLLGDSLEIFIWASIITAGALFCLFKTRNAFKKLRLVEDMPTSLIRSASQGFTELVGVGKLLAEPLVSPLTSLPCLWWRYNIERYKKGHRSQAGSWVSVKRQTSEMPFNIDDGTGLCQIFPAGAELSSRHKHRWYGRSLNPNQKSFNNPPGSKVDLISRALSGFGRRYRFTEHLILDGDPLYVLGHFETDTTGHRTLSVDKVMGNILSHWKQDFGALLEQYDTNGDGELCLKEWRQVRAAAEKSALKQQAKYSTLPAEHSIREPEGRGLPFIISHTEQIKLSRSFGIQSVAYALGFLGLGSASVWLWSTKVLG